MSRVSLDLIVGGLDVVVVVVIRDGIVRYWGRTAPADVDGDG